MKPLVMLHTITVAIAASYVTLGLATPHRARDLWWAYGLVMLVLSAVNLAMEYHHGRR